MLSGRLPLVGGAHPDEHEARGDRLVVGPVAKGDGLRFGLSDSLDQRPDRLGRSVGLGASARPARLAFALGDLEGDLGREHRDLWADREHVLAARGVKAAAQAGVLSVGAVAQHRRGGNRPTGGALDQLDSQLGLGLESDVVGDLRRSPPPGVLTPLFGKVKRPAQGRRPLGAGRVQRDTDLAVADPRPAARPSAPATCGRPARSSHAGTARRLPAARGGWSPRRAPRRQTPRGAPSPPPGRLPGRSLAALRHCHHLRLLASRSLTQGNSPWSGESYRRPTKALVGGSSKLASRIARSPRGRRRSGGSRRPRGRLSRPWCGPRLRWRWPPRCWSGQCRRRAGSCRRCFGWRRSRSR